MITEKTDSKGDRQTRN